MFAGTLTQTNRLMLFVLLLLALVPRPPTHAQTATSDTVEVPIELTVRDGREARRDMVVVRAGASGELSAYSSNALTELLDGMLASGPAATLERTEWITPNELQALGLEPSYDPATLTAEVFVSPEAQPLRDLSARGTRSLPDYPRVPPAALSAALPLYFTAEADETVLERSERSGGSTRYTGRLSPAVTVGDYLLASDFTVRAVAGEASLDSWEAAAVRDFDESLRATLGTTRIDTVGFESGKPVLGAGVERRRDIGGEEPLSERYSTRFTVETESTAEIYVNERLVRSIRLAPGVYELSDFPLVPGLNHVRVVLTDTYGDSREVAGEVSHAPGLLPTGELAFGVAGGTIGEDYLTPLGRGYFRYGLLDTVTVETSAEGTEHAQLLGVGTTVATPAGNLSAAGASVGTAPDGDYRLDYAARGLYRYTSNRSRWVPSVGLGVQYRTDGFLSPGGFPDGDFAGVSPPPWQFTASVNQLLPFRASLLLGGAYTPSYKDRPDSSRVFASLAKQIGARFSLRAGASVRADGGETDWQGEITFSTRIRDGNGSVSSTYHVLDEEVDARTSQRFRARRSEVGVGVSLSRVDPRSGSVESAGTTVRASHQRGEASASVYVLPADDPFGRNVDSATARLRVGTGLYYSDGVFGVGRPSSGSFALVSKARDLPPGPVLVNPRGTGAEARTGPLGAAVLTNLPDYGDKVIDARLPDLPIDYALGPTAYVFETGHRSGAAVRLEAERLLYGRGRLVTGADEPIALTVFELAGEAGEPVAVSFTDENGVFYVYDLGPGTYRIRFGDRPGEAHLELSGGEELPFDAGNLRVTEGEEHTR